MKKKKYLVTSCFDNLPIGNILNTIVLKSGSYCGHNRYLVFHPPLNTQRGSCASIEFCREEDDILLNTDSESYCNFTKSELKSFISSLQNIYSNWDQLSKINK